jgi:glycosyltransferase involved in cell wall biosynthesis
MTPNHNSLPQILHCILDARIGGPHIYVKTIEMPLSHFAQFKYLTAGRGPITSIALFNLRQWWSPLYAIDCMINALLILILVQHYRKNTCILNVHGVANIAPIIAATIGHIPVLWLIHETYDQFKSIARIGLFFCRLTRHHIAVVASRCSQVYNLSDATLMPPPIDTDFWRKDSPLREIEGHSITIVSVGNLYPTKGQDILLDAAMRISMNVRIKLIGEALPRYRSFMDILDAKVRVLQELHPNITIDFCGRMDSAHIRKELSTCTCFVLPSRSEAAPIVLLEAMSLQTICIAADVGGTSEIITHLLNGYLFPRLDVAALSAGIDTIAGLSAVERDRMGHAARTSVEERCAVAHIAEKYSDLIQALLRPKRPNARIL